MQRLGFVVFAVAKKERGGGGGGGEGRRTGKGVFMSILEGTISVRLFIAVFPPCGFVPQ